ncbi:GNAT family N-acetyltransferase [Erythrobacter tepidarius]|uniref:GNAT family N-acetyltransferase n=1 Tax=Erythrobacter tepidarius TaxID=60454 RepID=UPI000A37570B|nr:GNAT family N-acetyltransferase [Erythrobacter tepidarius]
MELSIELPEAIRRAGPAEARRIGEITAEAFREDPFSLWLFRNFAGIRALFLLQAKHIYVPRGFCYTAGDDGACMWMMPGGDNALRSGDYLRFAAHTLLASGPGAIVRAMKTGQAMEARHPAFPHAYLFSIGVRPRARHTGLGRRLIAPVLDACDRTGTPAYLENSNRANAGFYASCGFEMLGEPIHPMPDSPPLQPMIREPR